MTIRSLFPAALPAFGMLLVCAPLHAQVTSIPLFETHLYQQSGPTTLTSTGAYFNARIFETNAGDATNATLTFPGPGSPVAYTQATYSPTILTYASPIVADQAALDAAFPTGTYTTNYTDAASNPQSVSVNFTTTAFATSAPAFTASTYNAMQGLNAGQDFTFAFNADSPSTVSDKNYIFLNIFNASTGALAASFNFEPASATQFTVAANTFQPGTSYTTDLIFSDRITSGVNGIDTSLGFDQRTESRFTTATAVPEASTTASLGLLLALGLGGMAVATKRKKASA